MDRCSRRQYSIHVCEMTIPVLGCYHHLLVTRSSPRPAERHWCCRAIATCPSSHPAQTSDLRLFATSEISCIYLRVTGYISWYSDSLRGSNPGWGEIFRTRPDRPGGPRSLLHNGYRVPSPTVKRQGCGTDQPPHLVPRLKKEYSYISTPPLGLRGLF
jgi:hypothetical protein